MLPTHPSEIGFAFHRAGNAGHPGRKQPHVKLVALFNCHGQLNEGSTKVLMFPFATPCKAQGFQSKQCNFIIFELCRFIPAYPSETCFAFHRAGKAGLSRHLPVK